MTITGATKQRFLNFAIIITLMCLFGTAVNANAADRFTIQQIPALSFSGASGSAVASQSFRVVDTSPVNATFSVATDQTWISAAQTSTTTAFGAAVIVAVNTTGLAAGTYSGHVIVTIPNQGKYTWINSPYSVAVTLTVTSGSGSGSGTSVAPTITSQPASQTVASGKSATFNVAVTGTAPISFQWRLNGRSIRGATSSSYTTPAETASGNNSQFTVSVSNKVGNSTSDPANLTVASSTAVAPAITTQPASQTVVAGKTATFNVAATGTAPLTYQWSMNGVAISGATSSSYTTPAETTSNNNSTFAVSVSNSAGSATSNAAVLTVNAAAVAPAITTQPVSQTVVAGNTATFNVVATGTAPMTYQWSMNGAAISGATSSSYTTPAETTSNNNAKFTVAVSNSAGSATSNSAVLTVTAAAVAPSITTQPASQTIIAGNTASFSVVASGTAPMTYQWSMNGTPISGATSSSYTTPAETTSNNSAKFTVAVSNSVGSATSNAATLTVSASTLTLNASATSLSFGSVNVSSSSTKTVTLTNAGNTSITISGVTVSGAGFNASGVSSGLILAAGQSATLTATFSPSVSGSMTGNVTVASNASNSPDSITLSGTGVATVNHSVSLSWTGSTSSVMGYNTYSSTTSGGPYTKLTSSPVASTTYTDSTVQAGLTYYYVVTSVATGNVESAYSGEISANVP